jgi:hypothetical protein
MSTFTKAEKSLHQIKYLFGLNANIKKLLYNMVPSALEEDEPTAAEVDSLITLNPYLEDNEGNLNSYRNAFIVIYPSRILVDNIGDTMEFRVGVFTIKDYYILDNQKIRPLSILHEIEKELENRKLEFAGKCELVSVTPQVIELGKYVGFVSDWEVVDGKDTAF